MPSIIPERGIVNRLLGDPNDKKSYVPIPEPKVGGIGAQIGATIDSIMGSERIGLDPGEALPYGEASEFDMAATTMVPGPSLNRFKSLVDKQKRGIELTEAESKLLDTWRKKYGAPLSVKEGEGKNPVQKSQASLIPIAGDVLKKENLEKQRIQAGNDLKDNTIGRMITREEMDHAARQKLPPHSELLKNLKEVKFYVNQYIGEMLKDPNYGYSEMRNIQPETGAPIAKRLGVWLSDLSYRIDQIKDEAYDRAAEAVRKATGKGQWQLNKEEAKKINDLWRKNMAEQVSQDLLKEKVLSTRNEFHHIQDVGYDEVKKFKESVENPIKPKMTDLEERQQRIRDSLAKINATMEELRGKNTEAPKAKGEEFLKGMQDKLIKGSLEMDAGGDFGDQLRNRYGEMIPKKYAEKIARQHGFDDFAAQWEKAGKEIDLEEFLSWMGY